MNTSQTTTIHFWPYRPETKQEHHLPNYSGKTQMSVLSNEERDLFIDCSQCIAGDPNNYEVYLNKYNRDDASFDYRYLMERLKMASTQSPAILSRVIKELRTEVRPASASVKSPWSSINTTRLFADMQHLALHRQVEDGLIPPEQEPENENEDEDGDGDEGDHN